MARLHDPDFVGAGRETTPQTSSTPEPTPQRSYDFLRTWNMPTGGLALASYNVKRLGKDFNSKHQDYLRWQQYQRDLQAAQELHKQLVFDAETEFLIELLRFLDNKGVRAIMAFCNIKSAGKTTDLLQVLSVIAQYTRRTVLAIPATQNNATSTLALMAGIPEQLGITIEELSRRIKELGTYLALSKEVPKTPNGVGIVSEDLNNALTVDNNYNLEKFIELLLEALPNVDYVGLDLGNDNIQNDSIALAAARFAHVLNFAFLYKKAVATRSFHNTVQGYNTDLRPPEIENSPYREVLESTGIFTPTPEKVAHSIVIANLADLDEEIDFDEHMRPIQRADAAPLPPWNGTGIKMPYDPYLDNEDASGVVKPADLSKVTPVTHQQALRIAVANLQEAARLQGIDITDAPVFTPPPVPAVEHPFPAMLGAN